MIAASFLIAATMKAGGVAPVRYESFLYRRHLYHVVRADLNSGFCEASTVCSNGLVSAWNLIGRSKPVAAITGTFFSPGSEIPVADVLVNGNLVARGSRGTAIGVDYYGSVSIFDRPFLSAVDWSNYKYGLRGAVRVVDGGRVMPDPKSQKFHDSNIWGSASRTGIGLSKDKQLYLFATNAKVTLSEFGSAMKSRGIRNGVSLDGGASTCMYYRGDFLIAPHRKLCNMFVVCEHE